MVPGSSCCPGTRNGEVQVQVRQQEPQPQPPHAQPPGPPADDTADAAVGDGDDGRRSAFVLEAGVPYVPAWAEADAALRVLVRELAACGLAAELPYARAEVTAAGVGVVEL